MPVLFQDADSNYTTDDTLESGDDSLESVAMNFSKALKDGVLFITIGGSGTFSIQVKMGDGLSNYGPYKTLKDEDLETVFSPATLQFNLRLQEFWCEGVKQFMFKILRISGSGDVPITDAVFNHVI